MLGINCSHVVFRSLSFAYISCKFRSQTLLKTMADQSLVRLECELKTTENLQEEDFANWDRLPREKLDSEDRRWPCFTKRVMRGSTHHLPQSVVCIPTPFMREHPDTFKAGNLITLEGPSGNTWKVRASDKPIIHSGWRAFSHDHDLTEGEQLCFNLTQPGHFVVDILDANGEVKGSALSATNTGKYTVASINNPCEYVRRSRKRRNAMSPIMKTPRMSRAGSGYGMHGPTIASRCKTTARRRNSNDYLLGTRLRFPDKAKLWVCHEEMEGHEVVTILDSDDEAAEEDNRLLDSTDLSFGSTQVQRYRVSKIQRLLEYMKSKGEYVPRWSIPSPHVALAVEDQRMVAAVRESEKISHQRITGQGEEKVARASDPIISEGSKTRGHTAENQVKEARMEKSDPEIVLLPCQAQTSCDEDMTMSKEEDKTHLEVNMEVGNNLETVHCADLEALQSHKIPSLSQEGGATGQESHVTVSFLDTIEAGLPANPSQELLKSSTAMSDKSQAEAGGEFLFSTLQNIVDMPVIADTTNGGQSRDSVNPLMRDLIIQELAKKKFDTQVENELHFKKIKDSENKFSMLQSSSASKGHKSSDFPIAKVPPGSGYGASETADEDEIKLNYLHFLQPPKATVGHPRRQLEFKQFLRNIAMDSDIRTPKTLDSSREKRILQPARNPPLSVKERMSTEFCVLESKRGKVGSLDREKTLKAAQTWTKKLRNPNFVTVMQTSNVYYDFIMDIPDEFVKKSRLPATETKAMLICDEVPTMCKAVWDGTKLNAQGWMEFSRSHYLEEGDVCVFELHNRVAVRIGVHIFRVVGLRRSLIDWTKHYNVVHLGTHQSQISFSQPNVEPGSTRAAALQVL